MLGEQHVEPGFQQTGSQLTAMSVHYPVHQWSEGVITLDARPSISLYCTRPLVMRVCPQGNA